MIAETAELPQVLSPWEGFLSYFLDVPAFLFLSPDNVPPGFKGPLEVYPSLLPHEHPPG